MKITSTYSVRLRNFNLVFDDTVEVYRHAVDYFIELVMANWNTHFANLSRANDCIRVAEGLSVRTKKRLMTPYNFCHDFMKFPSYLRRAAIMAAYGQVSSYQTRLAQWKAKPGQKGRQPGLPKAGTPIETPEGEEYGPLQTQPQNIPAGFGRRRACRRR